MQRKTTSRRCSGFGDRPSTQTVCCLAIAAMVVTQNTHATNETTLKQEITSGGGLSVSVNRHLVSVIGQTGGGWASFDADIVLQAGFIPVVQKPTVIDTDADGIADVIDIDDDGDQILDAVETANQLDHKNPADALEDRDGDGLNNLGEIRQNTDLDQPDVRLFLVVGTNLVHIPIELTPPRTSWELATELGPDLQSITRLNPATGEMETTLVEDGNPLGANFPIDTRQAYFIDVVAAGQPRLSGNVASATAELQAGANFAGFVNVPADMTAYGLLPVMGGANVIGSVSRLDSPTGRYQTAAYQNGQPIGPDFPVSRGEGYVLTMHQAASGLVWP